MREFRTLAMAAIAISAMVVTAQTPANAKPDFSKRAASVCPCVTFGSFTDVLINGVFDDGVAGSDSFDTDPLVLQCLSDDTSVDLGIDFPQHPAFNSATSATLALHWGTTFNIGADFGSCVSSTNYVRDITVFTTESDTTSRISQMNS